MTAALYPAGTPESRAWSAAWQQSMERDETSTLGWYPVGHEDDPFTRSITIDGETVAILHIGHGEPHFTIEGSDRIFYCDPDDRRGLAQMVRAYAAEIAAS